MESTDQGLPPNHHVSDESWHGDSSDDESTSSASEVRSLLRSPLIGSKRKADLLGSQQPKSKKPALSTDQGEAGPSKTNSYWSTQETEDFLNCYLELKVNSLADRGGATTNFIFAKLSQKMSELGYDRVATQLKAKFGRLTTIYNGIKAELSTSGAGTETKSKFRYFDLMEEICIDRPINTQKGAVDSLDSKEERILNKATFRKDVFRNIINDTMDKWWEKDAKEQAKQRALDDQKWEEYLSESRAMQKANFDLSQQIMQTMQMQMMLWQSQSPAYGNPLLFQPSAQTSSASNAPIHPFSNFVPFPSATPHSQHFPAFTQSSATQPSSAQSSATQPPSALPGSSIQHSTRPQLQGSLQSPKINPRRRM